MKTEETPFALDNASAQNPESMRTIQSKSKVSQLMKAAANMALKKPSVAGIAQMALAQKKLNDKLNSSRGSVRSISKRPSEMVSKPLEPEKTTVSKPSNFSTAQAASETNIKQTLNVTDNRKDSPSKSSVFSRRASKTPLQPNDKLTLPGPSTLLTLPQDDGLSAIGSSSVNLKQPSQTQINQTGQNPYSPHALSRRGSFRVASYVSPVMTNAGEAIRNELFSKDLPPNWVNQMESWDVAPELLQEAMVYYQELYGPEIFAPPKEIATSTAYMRQDPTVVVRSFDTFDVGIEETYLYWAVRMGLALPIPPGYIQLEEDGGRWYLHKMRLVKIPIHPGHLYTKDLIRQARVRYKNYKDKLDLNFSKFHDFIDGGGHSHKVDLYLLRAAVEGDVELYDQTVQRGLQAAGNSRVRLATAGSAKDEETETVKGGSKITDQLLVEICNQAEVNRVTEPHLLGFVLDFLNGLEKKEKIWEPRCPDSKTFFWVNNRLKRAQKQYPYLRELKEAIEGERDRIKNEETKVNYKDQTALDFLFSKASGQGTKDIISYERKNLIGRVILKKIRNVEEMRNQAMYEDIELQSSPVTNFSPTAQGQGSSSLPQPRGPISPTKAKADTTIPSFQVQGGFSGFSQEFFKRREDYKHRAQIGVKRQQFKNMINELRSLLGRDTINDEGIMLPYDLRPFVNDSLRLNLTKEQVIDAIYYCFFDLETGLDKEIKQKLSKNKFFQQLYDREQNLIKRMKIEDRRNKARIKFYNGLGYDGVAEEEDDTGQKVINFLTIVNQRLLRAREITEAHRLLTTDPKMISNFLKKGINFSKKYGDLKTAFRQRKNKVIDSLVNGGRSTYKRVKKRRRGTILDGNSVDEDEEAAADVYKKDNASDDQKDDYEYQSSESSHRSLEEDESIYDNEEGAEKSYEDMFSVMPRRKLKNKINIAARDMREAGRSKKLKRFDQYEAESIHSGRNAFGGKRFSNLDSQFDILEMQNKLKNWDKNPRVLNINNLNSLMKASTDLMKKNHRMNMDLLDDGNMGQLAVKATRLGPDRTNEHSRRNSQENIEDKADQNDTIGKKTSSPGKKRNKRTPKNPDSQGGTNSGSSEDLGEEEFDGDLEDDHEVSRLFPSLMHTNENSKENTELKGLTRQEVIADVRAKKEIEAKAAQKLKLREVLHDFLVQKEKQENKTEQLRESNANAAGTTWTNDQADKDSTTGNNKAETWAKVTQTKQHFNDLITITNTKNVLVPPQATEEPSKQANVDIFDPSRNFFQILEKITELDNLTADHNFLPNTFAGSEQERRFDEFHQIKLLLMEKKKKEIQASR